MLLRTVLTMVAGAVGATHFAIDTTADAFIDPQNPVLLCRKRVDANFGVTDPIGVAVVARGDQRTRREPRTPPEELVTATMSDVFRPVTLTPLRTFAGFLTLWPTNTMPTIRWYGVFGAVGVALAWLYWMTPLRALLAMLPRGQSPVLRHGASSSVGDAGAVSGVIAPGGVVVHHRISPFTVAGLACLNSWVRCEAVQVDYSRIDKFRLGSPLNRADRAINAGFDGSYHRDVVVMDAQDQALHEPGVLQRTELLPLRMAAVPSVSSHRSIVDDI